MGYLKVKNSNLEQDGQHHDMLFVGVVMGFFEQDGQDGQEILFLKKVIHRQR